MLFYRGQDSSRITSLIYSDVDGTSKCRVPRLDPKAVRGLIFTVREMIKFAQDLKTCRKVAFAKVR